MMDDPSPDEKTSYQRTLIEQLSVNRPWLAKELQDNKLLFLYASILYAVEDALNLIFSYFSLAFAFKDSFEGHSDSLSATEWHDVEPTPEGLAVTITCCFFLFACSSLGTYFSETDYKDNPFMYCLAFIWPYVRDMLKALKWAYKGLRSTLAVILQFAGYSNLLFQMLFPIAIACSLLAILNRFWIRSMRADRKKKQAENDELCQLISEKSSAIIQKSELPVAAAAYLDTLSYVNTYIYLKYDENEKNRPHKEGVYWVTKDEKGIIYFEPMVLEDISLFEKEFHKIQSENLCKKMNLYIDKPEQILYFLDELPTVALSEDDPEYNTDTDVKSRVSIDYANSQIYLTNPTLKADQKFYRVDKQGIARLDPKYGFEFEEKLEEERKNRNVIGVTPQQVHRLFPKEKNRQAGYTYKQWLDYKAKIKIKGQSTSIAISLYIAAIFSAIIDGLYFYMGVLFITSLNPQLFVALFAMSAVLFVICFIVRIYEEYDYKRKLEINQLKVELTICETECKIIENILTAPYQEDYVYEVPKATLIASLAEQLIEYERLKKKIKDKTEYSIYSALCEGLRNGLAVQGIIASLMFLSIAIMLICGVHCSSIFVLTFISVSLFGLLASVVQFLVSYKFYSDKLHHAEQQHPAVDWQSKYANATDIETQQAILLEAKMLLEVQGLIEPPQFYVLGICECIRQLFSGYIKFGKTFSEITYEPHANPQESWAMFTVSTIFSVIVGLIFLLRTIYKTFYEKPEKVLVSLKEVSSSDGVNERARGLSWFSIFKDSSRSSSKPDSNPLQRAPSAVAMNEESNGQDFSYATVRESSF